MNYSEAATTRFSEGMNCAQAIFTSFAEQIGLDAESALKISTAFGGGIAQTGATCGAVTGALMVISLL